MRLSPHHFQVLLDGLDHVMHQVAQKRPVVHLMGVFGDGVIEGQFLFGKSNVTGARVLASMPLALLGGSRP